MSPFKSSKGYCQTDNFLHGVSEIFFGKSILGRGWQIIFLFIPSSLSVKQINCVSLLVYFLIDLNNLLTNVEL